MNCRVNCVKEVTKMSKIAIGVLKDDLNRLQYQKELLLRQIEQLPKGSLVVKKKASNNYVYLNERVGKRVITKYVGIDRGEKAMMVSEQIIQRNNYTENILRLNKEIKSITKVLDKLDGK